MLHEYRDNETGGAVEVSLSCILACSNADLREPQDRATVGRWTQVAEWLEEPSTNDRVEFLHRACRALWDEAVAHALEVACEFDEQPEVES